MSDPNVKVPLGHSVRLLHYLTGQVVFANGSDYGLSPPSRAQSQRWITGSERSGNGFRYSIESQSVQGRVRLAVNPDTYWHFLEPQWIWASQYRWVFFKLHDGKQGPNLFRMQASRNDLTPLSPDLFGDRSPPPDIQPGGIFNDGQLFSFLPEDADNVPWSRIEYDVDDARILSSTPVVLSSHHGENHSDVSQSQIFEVKKIVEESSSMDHSHGFSIMVGVAGKVGIPFVASGSVKTEGTTTHDWTYGKIHTRSTEITGTFPMVIPPRSGMRSESTMTSSTFDVPYTIYTTSKSTGLEIISRGTFRGVDIWGLRTRYEQYPLSGSADMSPAFSSNWFDVDYTKKVISTRIH